MDGAIVRMFLFLQVVTQSIDGVINVAINPLANASSSTAILLPLRRFTTLALGHERVTSRSRAISSPICNRVERAL